MAIPNYQYDPIEPPNNLLDNEVGTPEAPRPPAQTGSFRRVNPDGSVTTRTDDSGMARPPQTDLTARTVSPEQANAEFMATQNPALGGGQMPRGGLMATASGAAMPQVPSYAQEDADVVGQLNRITSRNSPYMMQARTAGMQLANKRGLLNSSMAAGASQAAALERAGPLAMANATNINARNLARINAENEAYRLSQSIKSEEFRQGRQLTSEEKRAMEENLSREKIATQAEAGALERVKIAEAAASDRLGRQLTQAEIQDIRKTETEKYMQEYEYGQRGKLLESELASRAATTAAEQAGALERTQVGEAGATERANLAAASAIRDRELANLSDERRATLQFYMQRDTNFAGFLTNIYANKDMPAPARDAVIDYYVSVMNAGADIPAGVYGVPMDWPGATAPAGTTPPAGTAPPAGLIGEIPTAPPAPTAPPPAATAPTAGETIPYTGQELAFRNGVYYDLRTGQRVTGGP